MLGRGEGGDDSKITYFNLPCLSNSFPHISHNKVKVLTVERVGGLADEVCSLRLAAATP